MKVTEAMVAAYLQANDAYWREVDDGPKHPAKWRNGTPSEATRVSLEAALAPAAHTEPCKTCNGMGYTDAGDPETGATSLDYPCPDCTQGGAAPTEPIDMILHCPACGMQHVDATDATECAWPQCSCADQVDRGCIAQDVSWTNPPHRSHLCHGCGHIWRPADVPTNGVAAIKTKGKNDSAAPAVDVPAMPEPAQKAFYFCNKCGSTGYGPSYPHKRRDGSECDYMAITTGDFYTAQQMAERDAQWAARLAAAAHAAPTEPSDAVRDVLAERRRQVADGFTPEHDDEHSDGEIDGQAASYLLPGQHPQPDEWCWKHKHPDSPKRVSRRHQIVIGVALGLAEIERLDRAARKGDTR